MKRSTKTTRRADGTARIKRDGYSNAQTDWWTIRDQVFKRDDGCCQSRNNLGFRCGAPGREVHHIRSLASGGTTTHSNLITLCASCHDARHAGHTIRRPENTVRLGGQKPKVSNPWGRKPKLKPYVP